MAQVLVLYNTPAEPAAFDRYYHEKHIPLARKIPGLRAYLISCSPVQALAGSAPYLVAILNFDSMADLSAALRSAIESKFRIATKYGALPARACTGLQLIRYARKPGIFRASGMCFS